MWVATANGTGQTRVATGVVGPVSWSLDGTRLVGQRYSGGLVVVAVASHAVTPIPGSAADEVDPQWSPDGTLIASTNNFRIDGGGGVHSDQVLRRPDGSSRVARPNTLTGPWSADGRRMLINDNNDLLLATDVLTGTSTTLSTLRPSADYLRTAWAGPKAYLGFQLTVPYQPLSRKVVRMDEAANPDQALFTAARGQRAVPLRRWPASAHRRQ